MERVLKETIKLLTIMIVILFFSIFLSQEPIEARANKIIENKLVVSDHRKMKVSKRLVIPNLS